MQNASKEQQAISILKQFIDQAIGLGLFKSADQVFVVHEAWATVKELTEQKPADHTTT